ncbi:cysteine desulfurase family protein [Microbacterium invictum]|uniref:Cysteine desulfurase n=1 Tax=Microbacterium invictum TaxID=515415 RepID=A0AA40SML9_9MICO|nr:MULTISPECIES: cysteine desulfurase family protein [Microbacterium]MBB4138981.1 cysteine desulfurase [Microbacterium invictum]
MTVYLDHAATTPLRSEARDAWLAATEILGNASSVHGAGQAARRALEDARERIARALGCDPIEVVLTSGGTESINLALKGLWWSRPAGTDAVVLPDGEHHATMEAVAWLVAHERAQVRHVGLDAHGAILGPAFADALPGAAAATAVVANNEVGTVNDVAAVAQAAADARTALHLDAVGAVGCLDISFSRLRGRAVGPTGLVALSVSGHKVGAPVGTGALVVSRHAQLAPLIHGGGQQRGLRAGTQDVAGAAALAVALECAVDERETEAARLVDLRERLIAGIHRDLPGAHLLGDPVRRLPGNVHILLPGIVGESMLFLLDQEGIAASTGSACQAGVAEPSHVVRALGFDERAARSVLRLTLGRTTTVQDVDAVVAALPDAYARAVAASSL